MQSDWWVKFFRDVTAEVANQHLRDAVIAHNIARLASRFFTVTSVLFSVTSSSRMRGIMVTTERRLRDVMARF